MSQQPPAVSERINSALLKIVRDNFNCQYATQVDILAAFREAVSAHGGTDDDDALLAAFRAHVPLMDYKPYKPFVEKFNAKPCIEADVENMFSPGLPDALTHSSATSGGVSKIFARYNHEARSGVPAFKLFDRESKSPLAAMFPGGCRERKVIERAPGDVVRTIPVCFISAAVLRRSLGWHTDDEEWLSLMMPGYAVPLATTLIGHYPTFLIIHGLFFIARKDVGRFVTSLSTVIVDVARYIEQYWDMLLSCVTTGILPDLEHIDHVRKYLQAHFHANPERAAELREIGPPSSCEGWLARIWPDVREVVTTVSGPFAVLLPKVKFILGPNITIRTAGYGSTEAPMGMPVPGKLDEFLLFVLEVVEFLDVSLDATHENLCQAWEVEVGKQYEPVVTTRDGLWRYRQGDVLEIVRFDDKTNAPVFKYVGRKSLTIRFPWSEITDTELIEAIQNVSSEDAVPVLEFTSMLDERAFSSTVGFFVEPSGPLGQNAHSARQKFSDGLGTSCFEFKRMLLKKQISLPTIRIVRPGTFAEFRDWRCQNASLAPGNVKAPVVLTTPAAQEWILERVIQEL